TRSGGLTRAFSAPLSLLFTGVPLLRSFSDSRRHSPFAGCEAWVSVWVLGKSLLSASEKEG
ncbi:hypothetical protein A2U01_0021971, partial [Trifolium medium]|nr:hypothetical protein [Trifolium medium]